jgi:hypothetical protein
MVMVDDKIDDDIKMYLRPGPFQRPCRCTGAMRCALPDGHVQGYSGSHWMPPLGDYLLCIAPAAAVATVNKTTMKNATTLLVILMATAVRRYNTAHNARWRRFRDSLETTGWV